MAKHSLAGRLAWHWTKIAEDCMSTWEDRKKPCQSHDPHPICTCGFNRCAALAHDLMGDPTVWVWSLGLIRRYIWLYFTATRHVPLFMSALTWMKPQLNPNSTLDSPRWNRDVWFCFHAVCGVSLLFEWRQPESKTKHISFTWPSDRKIL